MKDSQQSFQQGGQLVKYIKESNERFSTVPESHTR